MPAHAGQILRILGLLMEMFGLSSVALASRDGTGHWLGMTSNQVWSIVAVGFVFWLTGTVLNFNAALQRQERDGGEEDPS
ncbi:hypothetical protein [Paludisphaera mucosa]|uniref:Uncharacterized protein n=1 Tax=Paludisphaera mucosa TaxID=3030827 RepID=A0ABT6FEB0_9BACT|nr:hypothetical protein [Paludisphaera mucosa]MDG3005710.1 hypothetical protein [Paludisphaera mucosa]